MGTVSYSTAQRKARNARRRSDMKAIQDAMEQYYAVHNNSYPSSCPASGDTLIIEAGNTFIIPSDPKGNPYFFSCSSVIPYCCCAELEGVEATGNADNNACHFAPSGQYFCVKNLQ